MSEHILRINDGGTERQFLLDDEEWETFLLKYGENELVSRVEYKTVEVIHVKSCRPM